jgi:tryptophan synthase beta subunit
LVNLSGRGDKDMGILAQQLHIQGASAIKEL